MKHERTNSLLDFHDYKGTVLIRLYGDADGSWKALDLINDLVQTSCEDTCVGIIPGKIA